MRSFFAYLHKFCTRVQITSENTPVKLPNIFSLGAEEGQAPIQPSNLIWDYIRKKGIKFLVLAHGPPAPPPMDPPLIPS